MAIKRDLSITTRTSLLRRLKAGDDEASWHEFARAYGELIRRMALKQSLSSHEAEEVLQDVLISVTRNIGAFVYNPKICSFKRWLSNVTRWRITSQHRLRAYRDRIFERNDAHTGQAAAIENIAASEEPALSSEEDCDWGRQLLDLLLERLKKRVGAKQFQIYFLGSIKEKSVADVCRQLNVSRSQVYLAKLRVGRALQAELTKLRKEQ